MMREYDSAQIERMRDDLARYGATLGWAMPCLDKMSDALIEWRQEARAAKDYKTSDRIREILFSIGIETGDEPTR